MKLKPRALKRFGDRDPLGSDFSLEFRRNSPDWAASNRPRPPSQTRKPLALALAHLGFPRFRCCRLRRGVGRRLADLPERITIRMVERFRLPRDD
jgi:hypothetical protein